MTPLFRLFALSALVPILWILGQPHRYRFQPSIHFPLGEVVLLPLLLLIPLALYPLLVWALPRWRWIWSGLVIPHLLLVPAVIRSEGWWTPSTAADAIAHIPWGSLLLFRGPGEFYSLGRSWLIHYHPRVQLSSAELVQTLLTNACWVESQTLDQFYSHLVMVSSTLSRLETIAEMGSAYWWIPSLAMLVSTVLLVDALGLFPTTAPDPVSWTISRLPWLFIGALSYFVTPAALHPPLIELFISPPPAETIALADFLAPTLPPKGSLTGKTAVSKTAIGGSNPPPSASHSMFSLSPIPPLLLLFFLGTSGLFLFRNNIIVVLMGIELMLLAVNLLLVFFSVQLDDLLGQLFALFVLTVAAAESAIGLAILVVYYRLRGIIAIDYISALKGLIPPLPWNRLLSFCPFWAPFSPFFLAVVWGPALPLG